MAKYYINPDYMSLTSWFKQLPGKFKQGEGEVIWEGRNSIRKFDSPEGKMVVKRYKVPMLHQRMDYTFIRPSKAKRAYAYAHIFKEKGIATPEPIACIEISKNGLFHTGYFISKAVPGIELRKPLEAGEGTPGMKEAVAKEIKKLHEEGILHGDLNLTNMLGVDKGGDEWTIEIVDNNRSHFSSLQLSLAQRAKNFSRLTHNRELYVEIARLYAGMCGYDEKEFVGMALKSLDKFER